MRQFWGIYFYWGTAVLYYSSSVQPIMDWLIILPGALPGNLSPNRTSHSPKQIGLRNLLLPDGSI